jgi:hypothetical protein
MATSEFDLFPVRAQRLVIEWAAQYQQELLRMWNSNEFKQPPGLE